MSAISLALSTCDCQSGDLEQQHTANIDGHMLEYAPDSGLLRNAIAKDISTSMDQSTHA